MLGGYMGKVLWVDLSNGQIKEEALDEKLCRDFVGGYGIGSRLIYSRQRPGVNPLGPENILGFTTGPLTGSPALSGSRYTMVGKSPLTGTWGDANSGGDFGPNLKFAGYDAVFFTGAADKPVYLWIEEGVAELRDAGHLWGLDSNETIDALEGELGEEIAVSCIGPSGEKLSLISCPINNYGRAPGRSGFGAVMGSKKLKAVVVSGTMDVPLANKARANALRRDYLKGMAGPMVDMMRDFGTPAGTANSAHSGDSPVQNWKGVGITQFPNAAAISDVSVIDLQERRYACWRCPLGCGGHMKAGTEYDYKAGAHKPEYETLASFGTLLLNDNVESIIKANDICNRYGLDTISAGATIGFAMECYEKGILTREATHGIDLTWGNHRAMVAMLEKLAKREGLGDILADGVKAAAERIGHGSEEFAMHVGGQEIGMHDPRYGPSLATTYQMDATPGRHTQGGAGFSEMGWATEGLDMPAIEDKYDYSGKGEAHKIGSAWGHAVNVSGMCMFMTMAIPATAVAEFMTAVTGQPVTMDDLLKVGERVSNMRHAFNLREGVNSVKIKVPDRVLGKPAQAEGPLAGVTVDLDTQRSDYLKAMDWDPETGKPSRRKLEELGLNDVARDLWG